MLASTEGKHVSSPSTDKSQSHTVSYTGVGQTDHRSVLNILDSLLASQTPANGVVTIVCRLEIRKMAEC